MIWDSLFTAYLSRKKQTGDATAVLVFINGLTAIMSIAMSYLFLRTENLFAPLEVFCSKPSNDFGFFPIELYLWELIFAVSGVLLAWSIAFMRHSWFAHLFAGFSWVLFGIMWLAASIMNGYTSLFGFGILGIFIASWHMATSSLWRAEDL